MARRCEEAQTVDPVAPGLLELHPLPGTPMANAHGALQRPVALGGTEASYQRKLAEAGVSSKKAVRLSLEALQERDLFDRSAGNLPTTP
jgi:hypothetical protein